MKRAVPCYIATVVAGVVLVAGGCGNNATQSNGRGGTSFASGDSDQNIIDMLNKLIEEDKDRKAHPEKYRNRPTEPSKSGAKTPLADSILQMLEGAEASGDVRSKLREYILLKDEELSTALGKSPREIINAANQRRRAVQVRPPSPKPKSSAETPRPAAPAPPMDPAAK